MFVRILTLIALAAAQLQEPSTTMPEIIQKFAAKETESRVAQSAYAFRQDVRVDELDSAGNVRGEFRVVVDNAFDKKGKRTTKFAGPGQNSLKFIAVSPEDLQDLTGVQLFPLTTETLNKYDVLYVGEEAINKSTCYAFDVKPKKLEGKDRYFLGRIWVEKSDLHVVKTFGKSVPDIKLNSGENVFPRIETYRSEVDGHWFPLNSQAADTLNFSSGAVRIRQSVFFADYKKP